MHVADADQGIRPEPRHHRDRGYLTGVPVQPLVDAEAQMPAPQPSSSEEQRTFAAPEKRIHSKADLDRWMSLVRCSLSLLWAIVLPVGSLGPKD